MNYWETILEEVKNKDNASHPFIYTNLGAKHQSKKQDKSASGRSKENKMYYLGKGFKDLYLTQREAECAYHLLQGNTIVRTAKILGLSHRTVEFYVKNMKLKLDCGSKTELLEKISRSEFMDQINW